MTPERFRQVRDLAGAALERPEAERPAFLAVTCAGNGGLRADVDALLAAYEEMRGSSFMEVPASELAAREPRTGDDEELGGDTLPPGTRLGPYELGPAVGRGGMGIVYRAVRADDEYRQVVAVKVVRRGMDTAGGQRRFREERQILAGLEHPGIARLLDGGTTSDGVPYFVMEFVEGEPIDAYCDRRRLDVTERLRLFLRVCAAVHHAHRSLVVHRDLKPANVLVTAEGVPKLLDFGIARLVRPAGDPDLVDPTVTALRMLTPDYASPEQIRGEPVTTATDVYSLGVLLYELLSGQRPYRTGLVHEVLAAICDEDPERPSASVARTRQPATAGARARTANDVSGARATTPAVLRKKLAGDLDTIVLKALRKAPSERYASVEAFADDVSRHLEGRPVRARPHTLRYRAGKFVHRNPAAAAAATLAVAALLGGIVTTTRQARLAEQQRLRAERRFAEVRALANSFLFEFHDAIKDLPGSTAARELVVRRALQHLDSLAGDAQGELSLQSELAAAYEKVGDVQGEMGAANLGLGAAALQSYGKALQLREAVAAASPGSLDAQRDLAMARKKLGAGRLRAGDWTGAAALFEQVLAFHSSVAAAHPGDVAAEVDRSGSDVNLGIAWGLGHRISAGLAQCEKGLVVVERLSAADPSNVQLKNRVGVSLIWVGNLAGATAATRPRGLEAFRHSISIYEGLAAMEPGNAFWRQKAADGYLGVSEVAGKLERWPEALEAARQGQAIYASLEAADPKSAYFRGERAALQVLTAKALIGLGDLASARPLLQSAEEMLRRLSASDAENAFHVDRLAETEDTFGQLSQLEAARATDPGRRREHHRQALDWLRRADEHLRVLAAQGRLPLDSTDRIDDVRRRIAESEAALGPASRPQP